MFLFFVFPLLIEANKRQEEYSKKEEEEKKGSAKCVYTFSNRIFPIEE